MMRVVETVAALRSARAEWASAGADVGFIPTMGFLHAGHLALVQQARAENARVAASIFVNPTQFGPNEDLARYPRNLPGDLALLEGAGVDLVFTPSATAIYPPGFSTYVEPTGPLVERLEGTRRPGHFRGVCTVVLKLFNLVQPTRAYFGQKDGQQVAVVRRMIADLDLPVELRVGSTVREADGLARSSRNSYLGAEDRAAAVVLSRALEAASHTFDTRPAAGPSAVLATASEVVAAEPRAELDYVDLCDPDTFLPLEEVRAPALLLIAARVGPARLIDNYVLHADGTWDRGRHVE